MRLQVVHRTAYSYGDPVSTSQHQAHLAPRSLPHQRPVSHEVVIRPTPSTFRERSDGFGNRTLYFSLREPHRTLEIVAHSVVDLNAPDPVSLEGSAVWEQVRDRLRTDRRRDVLDAYALSFDSPHVRATPALSDYAAPSFAAGRPMLEAVRDLVRRIHADFVYDPQATDLSTPLPEVMRRRRGVCQDFAHVALGCLRAVGLAGRYVSGYLLTRPPPGRPRLQGADASHAWIAAFVPDLGWVDFDPTNDLVPGDEHVTVAWGRDFADVTPVRGVIQGGGKHGLEVAVDVTPVP